MLMVLRILFFQIHREVITAYGVTFDDFAIKGYTVAQRSVFVVEADGMQSDTLEYSENPGMEPDYEALFGHIGV